MSVWTEFLITAAVIVSIALQLGTRTLDWRRLLAPVAIVAGFAVYYLKAIPTSGGDGWFTLAGVALGVGLGTLTGAMVGIRSEAGRIITTAGIAYASIWIVTFAARFACVQIAVNSPVTLRDVFVWAYQHGITQSGWTAFFLLQALAMVLVRSAIVASRAYLTARPVPAVEVEAI